MIVTAGKADVSVYFYIVQDASGVSPGEPITGLLYSDVETGGSASYVRQGAARTDLTLVTLVSASAVHTDGGFILVDDTNMPGVYRCDYPDAAFAAGVDEVSLQVVVAAAKNALAAPLKVQLTALDLRTAGVTVASIDTDTVDAVSVNADVWAEVLDLANGVDTGLTLRQFFRLTASALFGKASGLGTTSAKYRNIPDDVNAITATVDEDGNRSAVTLDPS